MAQSDDANYEIGYKKPPTKNQFKKGQSGNPRGRPKRAEGVSISEVLDGKQRGKNGEVISNREAIVIRILNDALKGNQKAFARFLNFMTQSGLLRTMTSVGGGTIIRIPTNPAASPSPKTYAAWLRKEGRHEEADAIDPQL
jgi:hypothetical protein